MRRRYWMQKKKNKEKREEKKKRNKMLIIFRLNHLHFFPVCSQCSGQSFPWKKIKRRNTRTHIHWAAGATRPQTTSAYVGRPGKLINGFNELDEL